MAKAKINELDIVRAISILAVVMIHVTADWTVDPGLKGSSTQLLSIFMNKISYFAVPVFIFLSGIVLFYIYADNWSAKQAGIFYWKRVRQVLVPYILWSFFYYIYNPWLWTPGHPIKVDLKVFFEQLKWADSGYHLYFMIIIVQFYLLFPLLVWAVRKAAWFRKTLALWGLAIQAGVYIYSHWFGAIPHKPELCITYFGYFLVGGAIGMNYANFRAWLDRNKMWVIPSSIASGLVYTGLYLLASRGHSFENTWFEITWLMYSLGIGVSMIWMAKELLLRWKRIGKFFVSLGMMSFGVYLMHPALLSLWKLKVHMPGTILLFNLYNGIVFVLIVAIPWLLTILYRQGRKVLMK